MLEWLVSRSDHVIPWEIAPCTQWTGGWVGLRASLVATEKGEVFFLPETEIRFLPVVLPIVRLLY
jgi:hypothetical protein